MPKLTYLLDDPGLVENSSCAEHCVHSCFQMLFRTRGGQAVPSFSELDSVMHKLPGLYTYEYALVAEMPERGFDTKVIFDLDLSSLSSDPAAFFLKHYGTEIGQITIDNTDLEQVKVDSKKLKDARDVLIEQRPATQDDVKSLIREGYYVLPTVNQRILQADPGYVAHSIFVYGFSERGVTIHNPGPPSVRAAEITWDLFDKSWAFPDETARNVMAFRPR